MTEVAINKVMDNINDEPIIIDGETEIDDLLLASKFAELENIKSASIMSEIEKNDAKKLLFEKKNEEEYILLTENEEEESDNNYNSSEEEDKEIKELVKKEMKYRYKRMNDSNLNDELKDGLSNNYLKQFGMTFEEDDTKTKCNLSDLSEEDLDYTLNNKGINDSNTEFLRKSLDNIEDKLSWLPNIEIVDLPEKVDYTLPCEFIGEIYSIINDGAIYGMEGIYIIKSDPSSIMLDLGSVLCLEDKTIIGPIIDTFGPISSPFYVLLRHNSLENDLLKIGTKIFCDRRHSTILGKAGKVRSSYLSNVNKNNRINIDNKKSPFMNKEFRRDDGSAINFLDNELEEGEDDESESGDDINNGSNEIFCKKFVEKYENLCSIGESANEDLINDIDKKKEARKMENKNRKFSNKFNKNKNFSKSHDPKYHQNANNNLQNSKFNRNNQFHNNISIFSHQPYISAQRNQNQYYFQNQQLQFNRNNNLQSAYQVNEHMQFNYNNNYIGNGQQFNSNNISDMNYNPYQYMNGYYLNNIQQDQIGNNQLNPYNANIHRNNYY